MNILFPKNVNLMSEKQIPFRVDVTFLLRQSLVINLAWDILDAVLYGDDEDIKARRKVPEAELLFSNLNDYIQCRYRSHDLRGKARQKIGVGHAQNLLRLLIPETLVEGKSVLAAEYFVILDRDGGDTIQDCLTDKIRKETARYFVDQVYPIYAKDVDKFTKDRNTELAKQAATAIAEKVSLQKAEHATRVRAACDLLKKAGWSLSAPSGSSGKKVGKIAKKVRPKIKAIKFEDTP